MRTTETFLEFYTWFLHLAGKGCILEENLPLDLYDKLALELQRVIALIEESFTIVHNLQRVF